MLAAALYASAGLLAGLRHQPWLLIFLIFVQATVYLCGPIAAVWNYRARAVPAHERQPALAARRRRPRALFPRPAAAALTALCVGGVTSAFVAPTALLHATTTARAAVSPQSLQAAAGTEAYLRLGSFASGVYYPVTSARLSDRTLSFGTSSVVLLGEVLRAAADGRRISQVSLAFRAPGPDGREATQLVDTFVTATVSALQEHLSGTPGGRVSLLLPAAGHPTGTPGAVRQAGPFAALPAAPAAADVTLAAGMLSYAVTAVSLSQAAPGAPLGLRFTTSAQPLLDQIFQVEAGDFGLAALTLTIAEGGSLLQYTFARPSVRSLAENPVEVTVGHRHARRPRAVAARPISRAAARSAGGGQQRAPHVEAVGGDLR